MEKLKSLVPAKGAITDIWIEEATETELNSIKQLYKRQRGGDAAVPKRLTISFNPIMQNHWFYETYFKNISAADGAVEGNRMALANIRQRLELVYGTKAALAVHEEADRFAVMVRIPLELPP